MAAPDAFAYALQQPGYIPGNRDYNQWDLSKPGLFGNVGGVEGSNLRYGQGGTGDPTNGTEPQTPEEWLNGPKAFSWDGNMGQTDDTRGLDYIANLFGRPDAGSSGIATSAWAAPQQYWAGLAQQVQSGRVKASAFGLKALASKGFNVSPPGGPVDLGSGGAAGGQQSGVNPGGANAVNLLQPDALNALSNHLDKAGAAAVAQSKQTGYVTIPVFDADGRWSYETVKDAQGNPIRTVDAQFTDAQIAQLAAENAIKSAATTGKYLDPETGAWSQTPDALYKSQQVQSMIAADKLATDKLDFDKGMATGYINGQATIDQQKLDMDRQNQIAAAVADPTRLVEGALLANLYGTARGGQVPPGGPGAPGAGAPAAFATGPTPGVLPQGYAHAAPGDLLNPNIAVAPELSALLQGRFVPSQGNPSGVQGAYTPLDTVRPATGDFTKVDPRAFRNLTDAGQKQYGSLAAANQPGLKGVDLAKQINAQLPGSAAGAPSAFKF